LNGAVFAEPPVQDRERHVDLAQRPNRAIRLDHAQLARRGRLRPQDARAVVTHPRKLGAESETPGVVVLEHKRAIARDAHGDDVETVAVDRTQHPAGGDAADLMLARTAPEDEGHAGLRHPYISLCG